MAEGIEEKDPLELALLARRPDAAEQVARWWCDEWGLPGRHASFEAYVAELAGGDPTSLPLHVVAFRRDRPIGCATLKERGVAAHGAPAPSHWLSGVYVAAAARRQGVAAALCHEVARLAGERGIRTLFLFTEALDGGLYARLGWRPIKRGRVDGLELLTMARDLV